MIASFIEVIISHTRNSSVLKKGCGRRSHQIFLPLSMQLVLTNRLTNPSNSAHELKVEGMPVRGNCCHTIVRYDLRPVTRPCQKGELADSASTWGRKYRTSFMISISRSRSGMFTCTCRP